jgi:hypothetical protein
VDQLLEPELVDLVDDDEEISSCSSDFGPLGAEDLLQREIRTCT